MTLYLRARGLLWAAPASLAAVVAAAWFAAWLASRPMFDGVQARVPAVVLGSLLAAVCVVAGLHRNDDEIEGSTPRPGRRAELGVVLLLMVITSVLSVALVHRQPLQRGGLELVRDLAGLTGLALMGGSLLGSRLSWALPFAWASVSYLSVTRDYAGAPQWAGPGWLMFPATWSLTWVVAGVLLLAGGLAQTWIATVPRPRWHPLR